MPTHDEVVALASEVVDQLLPGLLVRTQEAHFRSTTPDDEVLQRIVVKAGLDVAASRSGTALGVRTTYTLDALGGEDAETVDDPETAEGWACRVTIHGQWRVRDADDLSNEAVQAFAIKVGVMALHAYARAHIQAAVVASGWPAYTMDVLTAQDDLFVNEEAPEEVDLSLISVE